MSGGFEVLVDSSAFVGWLFPGDVHHEKAAQTFQGLAESRSRLVATSFVIAETATVLSFRKGQPLAIKFLDHIDRSKIPVIHMDERLQAAALETFKAQTVKGTSVVDCANVVIIRRFGIPQIFSFDEVYAKSFGIETAQ